MRDGPRGEIDPAALLRALELHQAELEVQNSELLAANEELGRVNRVLESSHARFRALYQLAPTPFVTIDASRAILEVNQAAALILGAGRERLLGGTIDLFIDEEDRPRFRTFLAAVFVEGHTRCEDVVVRRVDRTPIDAMIDGVLLREAADDQPQCVLAIVDITARKLAETARREAQDEVLAIVSHDLRGPLNAISLGCDALASGLSPEEHVVCVAAIERAAGRCERLIRDLLGVARIESGRMSLDIAPMDVRDLVQQVCRDHEPAAAASRSTLTVSVPSRPQPIHGDRDRLHQVLSNLIGNALVHARGAAVEVSVAERDASIVIAVEDTGPGIPADVLPVVFEKYRHGSQRHGGAGLGLAIVKGLVEAHHGTATVVSEPGHGARFEVTLPRSAATVR